MKILVLNAGSSSLKYKLFDLDSNLVLASGLVEKIGEERAHLIYEAQNKEAYEEEAPFKNHKEALEKIISLLLDKKLGVLKSVSELQGVGHRVVHGGESFKTPCKVNEEVLKGIENMIPLAPLHNPPNLEGLKVSMSLFSEVPQVAVFDTSFHQTMPKYAFRYALPEELYEKHGLRRYGFHGTSHHYVAKEASKYLKIPFEKLNAITFHLGNGGSMAAIKDGKSIDTSMGMTPLEGLVMGTRSGDIDPAIPFFLERELKMDLTTIDKLLNKKSGLKGICGKNDIRDISELSKIGDEKATLALKIYSYRIKKYLGAYLTLLPNLDTLIFTAGIGENSTLVREMILKDLNHLGIHLDQEKNKHVKRGTIQEIQADDKEQKLTKILVVPTDEEKEIASQTKAILN
ncbi:MAG: acetate kinase [Halobacteriovoraceae bacterium]|nr:acetate kinase [Halobacteriovoraceae bacterium]